MKNIKIIAFLLIIFSLIPLRAQEVKTNIDNDKLLRERIYNENKRKIMNFSMKQFDSLFFDFFSKKGNSSITLTKEEFYNYTIQIAIFSDRLASLYPAEKEMAEKSKEKWFAESYEDYLLSKESQKK